MRLDGLTPRHHPRNAARRYRGSSQALAPVRVISAEALSGTTAHRDATGSQKSQPALARALSKGEAAQLAFRRAGLFRPIRKRPHWDTEAAFAWMRPRTPRQRIGPSRMSLDTCSPRRSCVNPGWLTAARDGRISGGNKPNRTQKTRFSAQKPPISARNGTSKCPLIMFRAPEINQARLSRAQRAGAPESWRLSMEKLLIYLFIVGFTKQTQS